VSAIFADAAFVPTPEALVREAFASFLPRRPAARPLSFLERLPCYMTPAAGRVLLELSIRRRAETLADRGDYAGVCDQLIRLEVLGYVKF
jgi:hypothetical protein